LQTFIVDQDRVDEKALLRIGEERPTMNRSDKLALGGVILVALEGASFRRTFAYHRYFDGMPVGRLLMAASGWVLATCGPIIAAALLWRLAHRFSKGWLLHLLLIPSLYVVLLAGERIMLSTVSDPDFDSTLGTPIMPAMLCALLVMVFYLSALVLEHASKLSARSSDS
jgi:hypothetical protein